MKHALLTGLLLSTVSATPQTGVLALLHNGQSSFFYTTDWNSSIIETALAVSVPGDTLILPGGTFLIYGPDYLLIDKQVVIIGAGYLSATAPVTQPTVIATGPGPSTGVRIHNNPGGFSMHGIQFDVPVSFSENVVTQNIDFVRCQLGSVTLGQNSGVLISQVHFQECLIGSIAPLNATGVSADNCIFTGTNSPTDIMVRNSVIHNWMNASSGFFYNCIILRNGNASALTGTASYFDCVFVANSGNYSQGTTPAFNSCVTVPFASISSVFNSMASLSASNLLNNYHNPTGPATDHSAGIYFGSWPWKDGAIPFNPHWLSLTIPGATNGGVINVSLSGAAQQN